MSATQLTVAAGTMMRSITFSRANGVLVGVQIISTDGSSSRIGSQTSDNSTLAFGNNEIVESMNIFQSPTAVGRVWITTSGGQEFDFGVETDGMEQELTEVFSGYFYGITCNLGKGNVISSLVAWFLEEVDGGYASNFGGDGYTEVITYETFEVIDFDSVEYEVLILTEETDNLQIEEEEVTLEVEETYEEETVETEEVEFEETVETEEIVEVEETEETIEVEETEETVEVEETYETYEEDAYVANEVEEEGAEVEDE